MNNSDKGRYRDDLERERLIYANGEYYRVRENWFSGGPYAVPRMFFDPYGPWRMARPVRHPLHYWEDLEFKYQGRLRDDLRLYYKHYIKDGEDGDLSMLSTTPLGANVTAKMTPIIEIAFGDSSLNYKVEVEDGKVYRIDYMKDATLSTVIGRIASCDLANGYDYRGKETQYVVIKVDCSMDFESDVRLIDSRTIRYIKSLEELQTATSVTRTFVSTVEPEDTHGEYGGWYNPKTNEYFVKNNSGGWVPIPTKPSEEPEEGKYWSYNSDNVQWEQKEIPPKPEDFTPNTVWTFDFDEEKWKEDNIAPKEPIEPSDGEDISEEYKDRFVPAEPSDPPGYGKEWYWHFNDKRWKKRDIMPDDGIRYIYNQTYNVWEPGTYVVNESTEIKTTIENYITINNLNYYVWYNVEDGNYKISPNVSTYNPETNTWEVKPSEKYNIPTEEPKDGYEWTYSSYFNLWNQSPKGYTETGTIPIGVNGHAFGREGVIIGYRPGFTIAVQGYTQFVNTVMKLYDYEVSSRDGL